MKIVRIWEGLGNQMFQYAYARYVQEHTGEKVFLEGRRMFRSAFQNEDLSVERRCCVQHFCIKVKFIKPKYLVKWNYLEQNSIYQKIKFQLACKNIGKYIFLSDANSMFMYHEEFVKMDKHAYVMGHFFHRDYIEPIRDLLLEEFQLKNSLVIADDMKQIFNNRETVSIHIRRGDYLYAECAQTINKEMQKKKYYQKAIKYIANKIDNPFFLIFSDDIEWVKNNFSCPYPKMYMSDKGYKDYEELILMSMCKHNIIANSTFSFWGAWLNQNPEKIVMVPKHWMPSIVPKEWIQI